MPIKACHPHTSKLKFRHLGAVLWKRIRKMEIVTVLWRFRLGTLSVLHRTSDIIVAHPDQQIYANPYIHFLYQALGNMIRDVYPGSGFFPIPYPEIKKAPDPGSGSATLVSSNPTCINHSYNKDGLSVPLSSSLCFNMYGTDSTQGKYELTLYCTWAISWRSAGLKEIILQFCKSVPFSSHKYYFL